MTSDFFHELRRYGSVLQGASGILPKILAKNWGIEIDDAVFAKHITHTLGDLKGPILKIAQILGTIPDMLPETYAEALRTLQSNAPPMGWPFVRRRMVSELGSDWEARFLFFEKEAFAAASLGQVHKARDLQGQALALKLQYPAMEKVVIADLKQLLGLLKIYGKMNPGLKTDFLYEEIKEKLLEELDYTLEQRNVSLFREILSPFSFVKIPYIVPNMSTHRLLALEWLEGKSLLSFKEASLSLRSQICENLFKVWYYPLYTYGVLHGDPHLGNYQTNEEATIFLFDFGCVRVFPPKFLEGVVTLYKALLEQDEEKAIYAYEAWGFTSITKELKILLDQWAKFLYGPLLIDKTVTVNEISASKDGQKIASRILQELRKGESLTPPREFVFMDRAAVALGSVFMRLDACLNWHRLFEELINPFNKEQLHQNQKNLEEKGLLTRPLSH